MNSKSNNGAIGLLALVLLLLLALIPAAPLRAEDSVAEPPPGSEPPAEPPAEEPTEPAEEPVEPATELPAESPAEAPADDEAAPTSDPIESAPGAPTAQPMQAAAAAAPDIVPLTPARLVDTRKGQGIAAAIPARAVRGVTVTGRGGIAKDAVAVVLNVTVTQPSGPGWLGAFPCSSGVPTASNINFPANGTVPNQVTVQIGRRAGVGEICFTGSAKTHVVVDVAAYYPAGSDFHPRPPVRLADTRPGTVTSVPKAKIAGSNVLRVRVAAPTVTGKAETAVLNVTVTEPEGSGYLTVYPCGQSLPRTSSVNFVAGQTVANAATVRVGAKDEVCIYSTVRTHVVVDLSGWFPPGSDLHTAAPVRIADTRPGQPGWHKGTIPAGGALTLPVVGTYGVPNGATAVLLNVTVTQPAGPGWVVAYPCNAAKPVASNLNFVTGQTVANAVLARLSGTGSLCLAASARTHVVVDLGGYYAGAARAPAAKSTFVRAQSGAQVFAVEPGGSVLPVTAAQLAAAGNPAVTVYPAPAGTKFQRAGFSTEVYAVPPTGAAHLVKWPEYVAMRTPAIGAVKAIPGTRFVKTSNSPTVYAVAPSGRVTTLTAALHTGAGSPTAQVVAAVPGSTFVRTERSGTIYAKAPDGTTRALSPAEYSALGMPKAETLVWAPKSVAVAASNLWASYRAGCPVAPSSLVRLEFPYWDMSGRLQTGAIVAAKAHANTILTTMRSGFDAHFPLQRVTPVEAFSGNDVAAMEAGNTSAFNCRQVTGNPTRLSQHSYGNAIDINTFQNPYVVGKAVYPAGSQPYLNRSVKRPGMLYAGDPIVGPLTSAGWLWGARWSSPDYQHLSSNGG